MVRQEEKNNMAKIVKFVCLPIIEIIVIFYLAKISIIGLLNYIKIINAEGIGIIMLPFNSLFNIFYTNIFFLVLLFVFSVIIILLCVGGLYDVVSYPKRCKKIKQQFIEDPKIPIRIKFISKKQNKTDSDILQKYIVEWNFLNKTIKEIPNKTIFYTDEPEFMFKYRDKETFIEYNDKYFYKYKFNLPE